MENKKLKGFTFIESITLLFIFSILTITFYQTISIGTKNIISSKNRLGAVLAANEKMEIIRNLKYEDVGTVSGAVAGSLADEEIIAENSNHFNVHTTVEYVDDPFDDVYPTDSAPEDYKKVTVIASWNGGKEMVSMSSSFVPKGLEMANPGDGFLRINVFSDQPGGTGIPNSSVHVINTDTGLDTVVNTDNSGSVILMGNRITNSIQKYEVYLSKTGYEIVTTLPPYPSSPYNPVDVHASVVVGSINVINIVQNELASLKVETEDYLGNVIPDIDFHITGGRIMGNTVTTDDDPISFPIYNLDVDENTDSSGQKDFGSVNPGQYVFTLDPLVANYVLIDTDPISPTALFSNQDLTLKANLANENMTSLLIKVVSDVDGVTPVTGAEVELSSDAGYLETQTTSETGTVFFPTDANLFLPGDYNLKTTASGFSDDNSSVTILQDQLKLTNVTLNAL